MKKILIAASSLLLLFAACSEPAAEKSIEYSNSITTEVVYRVELSASGSGGTISGEKYILTESGNILRAINSEKAFFSREGDTILVRYAQDGKKIVDVKFKK